MFRIQAYLFYSLTLYVGSLYWIFVRVRVICPCGMSMWYVHVVCLCGMSVLYVRVVYPIYGTYVLDQGVCPYIWDLCAGSRCVPLYMGSGSKDQKLRKKEGFN